MGSRLGPNYACLFVGYVKERMLAEYTDRRPDLYKRYMDDVAGAASGSEQDLQQFLDFASKYQPKLVYTYSISSDKLPFLDIYMTPRDDRISTSIYYKDTDSHSYLNFGSSHPFKCKSSIPHSQFLRLRKICSEDDVFQSEATTMEAFFLLHVATPMTYLQQHVSERKKNRELTYQSPPRVVTALRPTDPHWSLHTMPRTSPSVISHCEIIPFYGMTTAPRSHLTNRRLKPSVALKT